MPEIVSRSSRVDKREQVELAIPDASRLFRRAYEAYFAQINLTLTEALLIGQLDIADNQTLNQTDLAKRVGLRKAAAGIAIDLMVARGYIARVGDPDDGRAKLLSLTDHGKQLAPVVDQRFGELAAVVRRNTTREQRRAVVDLLGTMSANLETFLETLE
jgi:DNA-binding MarR family transcriptional regulator